MDLIGPSGRRASDDELVKKEGRPGGLPKVQPISLPFWDPNTYCRCVVGAYNDREGASRARTNDDRLSLRRRSSVTEGGKGGEEMERDAGLHLDENKTNRGRRC